MSLGNCLRYLIRDHWSILLNGYISSSKFLQNVLHSLWWSTPSLWGREVFFSIHVMWLRVYSWCLWPPNSVVRNSKPHESILFSNVQTEKSKWLLDKGSASLPGWKGFPGFPLAGTPGSMNQDKANVTLFSKSPVRTGSFMCIYQAFVPIQGCVHLPHRNFCFWSNNSSSFQLLLQACTNTENALNLFHSPHTPVARQNGNQERGRCRLRCWSSLRRQWNKGRPTVCGGGGITYTNMLHSQAPLAFLWLILWTPLPFKISCFGNHHPGST